MGFHLSPTLVAALKTAFHNVADFLHAADVSVAHAAVGLASVAVAEEAVTSADEGRALRWIGRGDGAPILRSHGAIERGEARIAADGDLAAGGRIVAVKAGIGRSCRKRRSRGLRRLHP